MARMRCDRTKVFCCSKVFERSIETGFGLCVNIAQNFSMAATTLDYDVYSSKIYSRVEHYLCATPQLRTHCVENAENISVACKFRIFAFVGLFFDCLWTKKRPVTSDNIA